MTVFGILGEFFRFSSDFFTVISGFGIFREFLLFGWFFGRVVSKSTWRTLILTYLFSESCVRDLIVFKFSPPPGGVLKFLKSGFPKVGPGYYRGG